VPDGEQESDRPAELRGVVAEMVIAIEDASRRWCRERFEESARRNKCQETLSIFARNPSARNIEEETKRDIFCTAVVEDPRNPIEFAHCREIWGNPAITDPASFTVVQRERALRVVYNREDVESAQGLLNDLEAKILGGVPLPGPEAAAPVTEVRALEAAPALRTAVEEQAVLGAEPAAPAAIRARRPAGRQPSFVQPAVKPGVPRPAAKALLDSVKTQLLLSVNECLKKCEPIAPMADSLTAVLREGLA